MNTERKKTYVITGSTSGIGKAFLKRIAFDSIVFAGYRNEVHKTELEQISDSIHPFFVDYAKPETIKDAAEYILSNTDKIDRLINIAGCVVAGPIECIEISELRRQFDVNVFGHLELTQRLIDRLDGGRVINISSMASFGVFPFIAPYCASKRTLDMLFNSILLETKRNIKIISIKPGVISTPLWSKSVEENSKYFEKYGKNYEKPMKYLVANAFQNEKNGLSVEKVADVIQKADNAKSPKLSYTVGADAFFASLTAKLPQDLVNKLIRLGIKLKCR